MEHDDLLGGDLGPPASSQNLEGVLRRHLRRRRRLTAGVAATVLALSLGGGAAIGEVLSSGSSAVASSRTGGPEALVIGGRTSTPSGQASQPAGGTAPTQLSSSAPPQGLVWGSTSSSTDYAPQMGETATSNATVAGGVARNTGGYDFGADVQCSDCNTVDEAPARRLFERTADGVTARVYALSLPRLVPVGTPASAQPRFPVCDPYASLLVEVSDSGAVGDLWVPDPASAPKPVDVVDLQILGVTEGSPMAVLVVRAGSTVHEVAATFADGATDSMPVVDGVAVLATTLPSGSSSDAAPVRVTASGASGQQVETFSVPQAPAVAEPEVCLPVVPPVVPHAGTGGARGAAGSGKASSGSTTQSPSS